MKIDRSNYEVWLIDWLDGKLDEVQIQKLKSFLKKNPDLSEEFEDLDSIRLNPRKDSFPDKNHIKKTTVNLNESQFEYLCTAYLENDLLPDQISELNATLSDPVRRSTFELIQKIKLIPPVVRYRRKHRLIKTTLTAKIIRLSVAGLSAAAMVAIGLFVFSPEPADYTLSVKTDQVKTERPEAAEEPGSINKNTITNRNEKRAGTSVASAKTNVPPRNNLQSTDDPQSETPVIAINKIHIPSHIEMKTEAPATLIAMDTDIQVIPDDGRSRVSKLIAKTFREKILNEPTPQDKPLKAVEIAEASVTGLNKILGWEMALGEESSNEGKTRKIYFNSRILKINAPANKTEPEL